VNGSTLIAVVAIVASFIAIVVIVALTSKSKNLFQWRKNETHNTFGDYHRSGDGDSTTSDNDHVVEFRSKFNSREKRKRG